MIVQVILPVVAILIVVVFLNCPIYIGILCATIYLQVFVNNMPLQSLVVAVFEALSKNSLLAIPFFILAGNLISASSLGERLISFFIVTFKGIRGGLPVACLVSNAFFGAICGSTAAATAAFSKIAYKPLAEHHGEKLALGLITSSASLSTVIPPSIGLIIYGIAAEASITEMFKAGFFPGILITLIVGIYLFFLTMRQAGKNDLEVRSTLNERGRALVTGIPVLILPVFILGSIYGGVCTPTEVGALSAIYCIVVGALVLRDVNLKKLFWVFKDTVKITTQIFLLIAMSAAFSQAMMLARVPQTVTGAFEGLSAVQFLLLLNVLLLVVGCFFDTSAALLIFVPLLLPTAMALGIDTVHLGIVFVVNLAIGMFTPPFGINIFVAQSVLGKTMGTIAKACLPYVCLYIVAVLILTYAPQISLFLPSILR